MNLSRVKTYLIIFLVIGNALLAGLFGLRFFLEMTARRQANEKLIALLGERGIIVSELPGETVTALALSRGFAAEGAAAAVLLGEAYMMDHGGGAVDYQNNIGQARFRSGGRFEITLIDGEEIFSGSTHDAEKACRELLNAMGFSDVAEVITQEFPDENTSLLLTFGQYIEKKHLYNARAEFRFDLQGRLLSVSGLWALGTVQAADGALCKSAGAALLLFSESHDAEVTHIELGYRLKTQTATADGARLSPEWYVVCGDAEYYLDGFTGVKAEREE